MRLLWPGYSRAIGRFFLRGALSGGAPASLILILVLAVCYGML